MPISASQRQGNTATCVGVETVANRLQRCVRFGRPLVGNELSTSNFQGRRQEKFPGEATEKKD